MEGFLLKQGVGPLLGKRYKRRWFKLVGTQMRYYKSQTDPEAIGFIDLKKGGPPLPRGCAAWCLGGAAATAAAAALLTRSQPRECRRTTTSTTARSTSR